MEGIRNYGIEEVLNFNILNNFKQNLPSIINEDDTTIEQLFGAVFTELERFYAVYKLRVINQQRITNASSSYLDSIGTKVGLPRISLRLNDDTDMSETDDSYYDRLITLIDSFPQMQNQTRLALIIQGVIRAYGHNESEVTLTPFYDVFPDQNYGDGVYGTSVYLSNASVYGVNITIKLYGDDVYDNYLNTDYMEEYFDLLMKRLLPVAFHYNITLYVDET